MPPDPVSSPRVRSPHPCVDPEDRVWHPLGQEMTKRAARGTQTDLEILQWEHRHQGQTAVRRVPQGRRTA
jgi:hypothetical protein